MIGIHDPWLGETEKAELSAVIDGGWLSAGGAVSGRFERALAEAVGSPQPAVATSSGSVALVLALRALGVRPGDHVLVSEYGFVATANAVRYACAEPIFLGPADEREPCVSRDAVAAFLAEEVGRDGTYRRTGRPVRGLLYNEPFGFHGAGLEGIRELLDRAGLFLVEDAAQAFGVRAGGRHLGTIGHLGVYSFNGNKTLAIGSGGALVGGDAALLARARHLSRQARCDAYDFYHDEAGYNGGLSGPSAAIGLAQVARLPEILVRKAALREAYIAVLAGSAWAVPGPERGFPAWLNVALAPRELSRAEHAAVAGRLQARGIQVRPVFPPVTRNPVYAGSPRFGSLRGDDFFSRGFCLPSGPRLEPSDAIHVAEVLLEETRSLAPLPSDRA